MKIKNQVDAFKKAQEAIIPLIKSTTLELIFAHVKHTRGLASKKKSLPLNMIWDTYYVIHPNRATPTIIHEQNSYKYTLDGWVIRFIGDVNVAVQTITTDVTNKYVSLPEKL